MSASRSANDLESFAGILNIGDSGPISKATTTRENKMNAIIAFLNGKTRAGYIITTRVYKGRTLQSGPSYNTLALAREMFVARGFTYDKTAKIKAMWI